MTAPFSALAAALLLLLPSRQPTAAAERDMRWRAEEFAMDGLDPELLAGPLSHEGRRLMRENHAGGWQCAPSPCATK